MQTISPFSNSTEAEEWTERNCNICKRYGCSMKKQIEKAWITGTVPITTWHKTGEFNRYCDMRQLTPTKQIRKRKVDKHQTTLEL